MIAPIIATEVRAGPLPMPSARPIPAPFARKIGIVTRELGLFRLSLVVVHLPAFHFLAARRRLACFLFGDDSRNCFNPCRISVRLPLRLPSAMCFSSHWMASPPPDDSDFRISWRIVLSFFVPIIRASPIGPTVLGCGELLLPALTMFKQFGGRLRIQRHPVLLFTTHDGADKRCQYFFTRDG